MTYRKKEHILAPKEERQAKTMTTNLPDEFDALKTITKTLEPFKAEDQSRMLRWISEKLGLAMAQPGTNGPTVPPAKVQSDPPRLPGSMTDISSFTSEKKPKNDMQFAAVVAYYYQFEAAVKKTSITKDDLLEACRLASYKRPKKPAQTLLNAVNSGLLDKAERGSFSINSVGENLVAITLPGDGAVGSQLHRKSARKAVESRSPTKIARKKNANNQPPAKKAARKIK
jgi:hypothetical protein